MSQHCKGLCDKDKRFKVSSPYCHTHGKYCSVCTKKVKTHVGERALGLQEHLTKLLASGDADLLHVQIVLPFQ